VLDRLIDRVSDLIGSHGAVLIAVVAVVIALVAGLVTEFSGGWEKTIVIGSALVTLLLVVAIRHTQAKSSRAMQIKLDEIIRVLDEARDDVRSTERATEEKLAKLRSA
jgi:low affinity Fe/Cu permease